MHDAPILHVYVDVDFLANIALLLVGLFQSCLYAWLCSWLSEPFAPQTCPGFCWNLSFETRVGCWNIPVQEDKTCVPKRPETREAGTSRIVEWSRAGDLSAYLSIQVSSRCMNMSMKVAQDLEDPFGKGSGPRMSGHYACARTAD